MKNIIVLLAISLIGVNAFSQNSETILNRYIKLKDALIKSDNIAAHAYSDSLQQSIEATGSFKEKESLLKAVLKMIKAPDIEKQRIAFADVSTILWKVVKDNSEIKEDVYYQYCPMKKVYWLSLEEAIQNPYYGAQMLTCGNVSDKKVN